MIDGHRGELRERLVDDQLCECVDVFNIDTGFGHGRHAQTVTECDIRVCSFPADLFGSLAAVKFSTESHADALDFVGTGRSHMLEHGRQPVGAGGAVDDAIICADNMGEATRIRERA